MLAPAPALNWAWHAFDTLSTTDLHDVLRLRQDVFIIEQTCPYPDVDGRDPFARHLLGREPSGGLVAYLRLFDPSREQATTRIGRVVVSASVRGRALGRELMQRGMDEAARRWPGVDTVVSAQAHLEAFYASLGFLTESVPYDEDGIAHIDMRRPA